MYVLLTKDCLTNRIDVCTFSGRFEAGRAFCPAGTTLQPTASILSSHECVGSFLHNTGKVYYIGLTSGLWTFTYIIIIICLKVT